MASKKQRRTATVNQARLAAKAEADRLRAEREAKAKRQRNTIFGITLGAVVLTVVLAFVIIKVFSAADDPTKLEAKPVGATADGGIALGQDGVAGGPQASGADVVTVDIYSDYICPYCGQLEEGISAALDELLESSQINLVLHPLALLDNQTEEGAIYSTRSANAAATEAAEAADKFFDFHKALYDKQPAEGSAGLTDDEMIEIAKEVGVPDTVADSIPDRKYDAWVQSATKKAIAGGLTGTPKVYLTKQGKKPVEWTYWSTGAIARAVEAVKAGEDPNTVPQ